MCADTTAIFFIARHEAKKEKGNTLWILHGFLTEKEVLTEVSLKKFPEETNVVKQRKRC